MHPSIHLSINSSIHPSIHPSIQSIHLSIYPSIYLSIHFLPSDHILVPVAYPTLRSHTHQCYLMNILTLLILLPLKYYPLPLLLQLLSHHLMIINTLYLMYYLDYQRKGKEIGNCECLNNSSSTNERRY